MLSMKEAIENYVEGCVGKVDCPAYKLFMKAILAGMMIAFGAAGSSVAAHDIVNVGINCTSGCRSCIPNGTYDGCYDRC